MSGLIPAAQVLRVADLVGLTPGGIASRTLAKTSGGNVTMFAFDAGEGLSEHRGAFDALVLVLEGHLKLTIGGQVMQAPGGTIVRLPADVPHAVDAVVASQMLLIMLKESKG